jgi:hypothetical protein
MRFHLGAIPESPNFTAHGYWQALREPTPWVMQLVALPIGVGSAAVVAYLWLVLTPLPATALIGTPLTLLLSLVALVPVHEFIHACMHPMAGRSSRSILGFWPSRALFYVHYDGELSRNRFVVIMLMPFLVITFVPLLVGGATRTAPSWLAVVSFFNALLASGDIFGVAMVLFQIPPSATVRNQGWRTHWRLDERAA